MVHAYVDSPDIEYKACPYEPLNTMPAHLLAAHLPNCPKAKELLKVENAPFYNKNVNFMNLEGTQFSSKDVTQEAKDRRTAFLT